MTIFTPRVLFVAGLLLGASAAQAQTPAVYQTISIIGSATAAGWGADTPLRLASGGDFHNWILTLPLIGGPGGYNEAKFRADNSWTVNWGDSAFPMGTGTANGPNIRIPLPNGTSGIYTVQFNDITGAYRFTVVPLASQVGTAPAAALTLFPNPAHETLTVAYDLSAAGPASLTVYNPLGQVVRQRNLMQQHAGIQTQPLSLQGLAAGLYVVQLQTGAQRQTARLVVE